MAVIRHGFSYADTIDIYLWPDTEFHTYRYTKTYSFGWKRSDCKYTGMRTPQRFYYNVILFVPLTLFQNTYLKQ